MVITESTVAFCAGACVDFQESVQTAGCRASWHSSSVLQGNPGITHTQTQTHTVSIACHLTGHTFVQIAQDQRRFMLLEHCVIVSRMLVERVVDANDKHDKKRDKLEASTKELFVQAGG